MGRLETVLKNAGKGDRLTLIKLRYGLEVAKNEVIKFIVLFIIFALLSHQIEYLFAVALLLPVRSFSGGMHMKSNIGCFSYSFGFFLLAIELLPRLPVTALMLLIVLAAVIVIFAFFSPIPSYKRPVKTKERRAALKRISMIILGADIIVLLLMWNFGFNNYFVVGVWVLSLQALQLFITWAYRKKKGERNVRKKSSTETVSIVDAGR